MVISLLIIGVLFREELGKNINTDEAAALGAVYKGADITAGFKVKRFIIKDLNLFPIDVSIWYLTNYLPLFSGCIKWKYRS